ncbi:translation initiation factor IF-2 [Eubacterium ramulus]|uniref:Translation initiation factor IF-2 n=1 Tax=Eubacterium ramulus TaxID=39490 RepID=A0A844DVV3_EUBRA|nr:translation initiation factor IF-2 [Eubacterium ramulus]MSD15607.1 translation initiation factor IF-2 [Eubacterium ramulus]
MAKIRVHEIAKEYDVTAKEVINFLHGHNIEVTNLSSLEDNAVSLIRGKYGKQDSTNDKKERPKKKASISAVYNPQNSKMGNRRPNNGNRNERNGDRPQRNNGDRPRNNNGDRPQRNNGDRPRYDGDRPQRNNGDRSRYDGDRPQRNNGDRSRYDGDRQQRNNGDRPQRRFGDRPQRQENGDRNGRYERKDNNNQKGFQGNRGGGNSFGGNRNNRQDGQNRSRETRGRLDQEISRMNRDSAKAPIEELRGKENTHANKKKNKQDYERKNRKQEQYVNLEKKTGHKKRNAQPQPQAEKKADEVRSIALPEVMTVRELAERIDVPASKVVEKLFMQGILATVNQEIDYEKAEEIALEFNCIAEKEEKVDVIAELLKEEEEDENTLISRPPVVCVMGHVDHGKTSLLDAIRETHVTDREAGGITQHIGASVVKINGQKITFLDTPGHEAFTAMRMRGANATDIAILVVAADDGIMPQTVEAISHAKAAGIEIIVAINKIDKESANIDYVKQGLAEQGLIPEDWGGSTICVPVSARTGEGITELLEMVLLTADILELKANPKRNARGLVIEAQLDKGRGVVATVLVQKGTLKVGEPIAAGSSYGKVRAMIDDKGRRVKEAGPSTPVEILGLNNVPNAGEVFVACDSEKDARSFAETFVSQNREKMLEETRSRMSLDDLFSQIQTGNLKELELIVKADVQGSVEAVKQSLTKLSNEEVVVKVIHGGVGAINESDVSLASASNAIIIGFNVKPDMTAKATAEQEKVDIRLYSVIYKAIEDIEAAMKGMLDPIFEEKVIGHAEVRQIFKASGVGNIAGSYVLDGVFERNCKVRITREGKQIFEGDLASLKRFKDDVKEVKAGYECGLVFDGFNDIAEFDIVEAYKMVEVPR